MVPFVHLDAPLGEGNDKVGDIIPDENATCPCEECETNANFQLLYQILPKLPVREQKVLYYRFGLDGNGIRTLEEVSRIIVAGGWAEPKGKAAGITIEGIRQIQNKALKILRQHIAKTYSKKDAVAAKETVSKSAA